LSRCRQLKHILQNWPKDNFSYDPKAAQWMEAKGVNAIENIDTTVFMARRVELKK